jgi:hypothetical protein
MTVNHVSFRVHGPTDQEAIATMPAGTTLLRARLACYTWFSVAPSPVVVASGPPATLLGVYWKATGSAVPLITAANMTNSEWYVSGWGELTVMDRAIVNSPQSVPAFFNAQHTYSTFIDLESANYQSGSFDLGLSINFVDDAFWNPIDRWITYEFTYWTD